MFLDIENFSTGNPVWFDYFCWGIGVITIIVLLHYILIYIFVYFMRLNESQNRINELENEIKKIKKNKGSRKY